MAALAFTAVAQDWDHDREERFRGEAWRHAFLCMCGPTWSISGAPAMPPDREHARLDKTKKI